MPLSSFIRIILVISLIFQSGNIHAQYVPIPDLEFSIFLQQNGYSSCVSGNFLDTTCVDVLNETALIIDNTDIKDLTGIKFFKSLTYLNVSNNDSLNFIPELPPLLETFYCDGCNFSSIPLLGDSLIYFSCSSNSLTTLPTLPNRIRLLSCSNNPLTSLPTLPDSLRSLGAQLCSLTSLPVLPQFMESINIHSNQIDTILGFPNTIKNITCWDNPLSTLPTLPDSLTHLSCGQYSGFTSLPALPNKLYRLLVELTSLTSLPPLPASLEELWCDHSLITSIPPLPPGLRYLICADNQITSLPPLPSSLRILGASQNQLTSIPTLPAYMQQLSVNDNPNLACLPQLNTIGTFYFANTSITCLPNYGTITNSSPALSSMPLCDLFNMNGCNAYWNISGKAYVDTNYNCINNSNEFQAPNIKVSLDSSGTQLQQTYTGSEGYYSFDTDTGTFQMRVDTLNLPVDVACPSGNFQIVNLTSIDSMEYNVDFGLRCKTGFDVGVQSLYVDSGQFRSARFANVVFNAGDMTRFYGLNCATGVNGSIRVVMTGPATFAGAAPGALIPFVSNDTLIYSINDFGAVNGTTDIVYKIQTDTTALNGDLVCFSVEVLPYAGDNNILNNNYQWCFIVANSFDPNNKMVTPTGIIDTSISILDYTINFQNTGNATAEHIYIIDTLDANTDLASFELTGYSHLPQIQITGQVVKFNFPGINLPDSTGNEPESHGFITYRIRLQNSLPVGTSITNAAHIFFDFNTPVATNTTINIIQDCSLIPQGIFSLNDSVLCKGELLTASANLVLPSQATWFINAVNAGSGLTIQTDTLSQGEHFIELVLLSNNCSQKLSRIVHVFEPTEPVISVNGNLLISSSQSGNQWYYDGNLVTGAITDTLVVVTGGWFMVAVTDSNSCIALSDSVFVSMVGEVDFQNDIIHLVPNPFNAEIIFMAELKAEGYLVVADMHSRTIFTYSGKIDGLHIPTENWSRGVYTITVFLDQESVIKKMVKY